MRTLNINQAEVLADMLDSLQRRTDRLFFYLFLAQWLMLLIMAGVVAPLTWVGPESSIHPHLFHSFWLGGTMCLGAWVAIRHPRFPQFNMYAFATGQMLFSALYIHVTGGRIESHFHVFGSLAFLASYRSTKVLLWATALTLLDHAVRGALWPQFIYGTIHATFWRTIEHALWVLFEDTFLIYSIRNSIKEMSSIAVSQLGMQEAFAWMQRQERQLSSELNASQRLLVEQQQTLVNSARMTALGEMAGSIAHEINNPLAVIIATSGILRKDLDQLKQITPENLRGSLDVLDRTCLKISRIIKGLRNVSRDSTTEAVAECRLSSVLEEVLGICEQKFKNSGIRLEVVDTRQDPEATHLLPRVQLSQVLVNLFNNSFDAVIGAPTKWIRIQLLDQSDQVVVRISDSGPVIPEEIRQRMFQPFYTTKEVGKGTGLGLSISKNLMCKMGGDLELASCSETCFVITLPRRG